ncbi:hypothetical protein MHI22_00210 [Lysinibacillus sp. FSL L8-0312]
MKSEELYQKVKYNIEFQEVEEDNGIEVTDVIRGLNYYNCVFILNSCM